MNITKTVVAATVISITLLLIKYTHITAADTTLLSNPWKLSGNDSAAESYSQISPTTLTGATTIKVSYDLHGLCLLPGDASAIIFDQDGWKMIALSEYGQNCKDGMQTVTIPLTDFKDINTKTPLIINKPLTGAFHTRIWAAKPFTVDINEAILTGETSAATPTPTIQSTPTPTLGSNTNNLIGIVEGQTVSGRITVGFSAQSETTSMVRFMIDNSLKTTERYAPYYLGGDNGGVPIGWDTTQLKDGDHTLSVILTKKDGANQERRVTMRVKNSNLTTPTPTLTPTITLTPAVTPAPTSTPTPTPVSQAPAWSIRSVDAMKDTKDAICGQRPIEWINRWLEQAVQLNANYVAISTPYDNPSCGSARDYTKRWITAIRAHGLKVWHRQMPLAFEGIYSAPKSRNDYLTQIATYIKNNPDNYQDGDIFTPIPEPQNGGISGITYCAQGVCQWDNKEAFNKWLRDAMTTSKNAFSSINKTNMKIGYFGFDGFVAWGANNPDWNGILEDATVTMMGNLTIDHYPELIGTDMATDIAELEARYPGIDIIIGEWGTVTGGNTEATVLKSMGALQRPSVKGFNYWQFGPSGAGEQLINDDFSHRPQFDEVKNMYSK